MFRKLIIFIYIFISILAFVYAQNEDLVSVGVLANYYKPKNDLYESALGLESRVQYNINKNLGIMLSFGTSVWDVSEYNLNFNYNDTNYQLSIDGENLVVLIGPSIFYQFYPNKIIGFLLESGLRYAYIESDIEIESDLFSSTYYYDQITLDDGIVGVFNFNLIIGPESPISMILNIGYQFDILDGEIEAFGIEIIDNELNGLILSFGGSLRW